MTTSIIIITAMIALTIILWVIATYSHKMLAWMACFICGFFAFIMSLAAWTTYAEYRVFESQFHEMKIVVEQVLNDDELYNLHYVVDVQAANERLLEYKAKKEFYKWIYLGVPERVLEITPIGIKEG